MNYHFGDKLELYTEVLRHSVGASGNGIINQALRSTAPPEEAFRELIHAMLLRVCRADRPGWHFRLMMHEFAQPTPAMASVIDETMRPVYDRFRELIGVMLDLPVRITTRCGSRRTASSRRWFTMRMRAMWSRDSGRIWN